jgi:hypothetical protein
VIIKNWARIIPLTEKIKLRPIAASPAPKDVVAKRSNKATPDTKGGKERGIFKTTLMSLRPGNL